ncbi:MAG: hypothetical protein E3J72_17885 [Planctomycetota bacterium]|nr:MAG: hypothetical protein E3J72_17885 [Planctomycetota bacterium]
MKCLILAAGRGSRLSDKGDSKPLIPLLGLSLIERTILNAKKAGLSDFHVVTGYNGEKVRHFLDEFSRKRNIELTHIINEEWSKGNGLSVLAAKDLLNEKFILLMGDHVFDESILVRLKDERISEHEVILAVDYGIDANTLIDIDDVTKVLVGGDRISDIGKDIKKYNAYDTGIFLCTPAIFGAIEQSAASGDTSLSGGIRILAEKGQVRAFDIRNNFWIDVDDEEALRKARRKLLGGLKKTSDGPISRYLNRPISIRISKYLVRTDISPNFISFLSFILCCIGAFCFYLGGHTYFLLGAILAQAASVIDGCDGEIARLKFRGTEFGAWFDAVLDRYADAFLLFGLTYFVYSPTGNILYLFVGFMAIIGSFMNSYTADKYDGFMKKKLGEKEQFLRMGRDVRMFTIFLSAILDLRFLTLGDKVNLPFLAILFVAIVANTVNVKRMFILYKNG